MSYDVFLSHNHGEKAWTRDLCTWLQGSDYNGRSLRAWLDVQILDPGELASDRELDSALDKSRVLALVLTPEAVASPWVQHEIDYFLATKRHDDVVVLRRRRCDVPDRLVNATLIEWHGDASDHEQRERLLHLLRPAAWDSTFGEYEFRKQIRGAWSETLHAQPPVDTYDPSTSERNSALLELLLSHDISDLDEEGAAVTSFDVVGGLTGELNAEECYHLKMVLGEYLAVAQLRDVRYARVAAGFVERDFRAHRDGPSLMTRRNRALWNRPGSGSTTNLLFAVARAGSKVAELDPSRIDLSVLWAVLDALDQRTSSIGRERDAELVVSSLVGRTLGKLRGTVTGEALLHALVRAGGHASHVAAAGAISARYTEETDLVYYTPQLRSLAMDPSVRRPPLLPPSPSTARLLRDRTSRLWSHDDVANQLDNALHDLERFFGDSWLGDDAIAATIRDAPVPDALVNGPLVGRVRRVTRANMEALGAQLGPTEIACLTESRIVDALFEGVGGFVIDNDQFDGPLGNRLQQRSARYAVMDRSGIDQLEDEVVMALWPREGATPAGILVGPAVGADSGVVAAR